MAGTTNDFRRIDGSYDFYGIGRLMRTPAIRIGVVEGGYLALNERIGAVDPATLARDLKKLLAGGYQIDSMRAFDMFPQTHHVETIVHLTKDLPL